MKTPVVLKTHTRFQYVESIYKTFIRKKKEESRDKIGFSNSYTSFIGHTNANIFCMEHFEQSSRILQMLMRR